MSFAVKQKDSLSSLMTACRKADTPPPESPTPSSSVMGLPALRLRLYLREHLPQALAFELKGPGPLPAFAPGQCVSLLLSRGASRFNRPFALCGTEEQARSGSYFIVLPRREAACAELLQDAVNSGLPLPVTAPWGGFSYQPLRDGRRVLALAEEDGLLSFLSLARRLGAGEAGPELTLCLSGRSTDHLPYWEELEELSIRCPRFRLVTLLTRERAGDSPAGPLDLNLLRQLGFHQYRQIVHILADASEFLKAVVKHLTHKALSILLCVLLTEFGEFCKIFSHAYLRSMKNLCPPIVQE